MAQSTSTDAQNALTGFWTGVYDYGDLAMDPVPFNAMLTDAAGALSGEIVEPNTFCDDQSPEVFASLVGARDGVMVSFVKRYEDRPGAGHDVAYEGEANAELTRITGVWRVAGESGPFVMNRSDVGVAAVIVETAEAER